MTPSTEGIEGLDPAWSRYVETPEGTWHLLDNGVVDARVTLLCVHGNPSWSYLWREVLSEAPNDVRVIAVDQLGMGFSERTKGMRRLATRVADLGSLTDTIGLTGPVITVAHDWGGPISLGWALAHRDQLAKVILLNTSVHQPPGSPAPAIIRLIRRKSMLKRVAVDTTSFILGAIAMSRPRLTKEVRTGLLAPYATAERREHIGNFVSDIPLDPDHPSAQTLDSIAAGLTELADTPVLLLWGPADPVFSDLYLHDLEQRLPHAEVQRYPGAGHFVSEDADVVPAIYDWLKPRPDPTPRLDNVGPRLWTAIDETKNADWPAITEMSDPLATISFAELSKQTSSLAIGLADLGVRSGDRVAIMIPPGIDLSVALYACWKVGAIVVLVDSGLGPKGMNRAIQSANPDYLIAIEKGLAAAQVLRWPGTRISVTPLPNKRRRFLGVSHDLESLKANSAEPGPPPEADDEAAIVFTSGSTGPSKGVIYRHGQIEAQVSALVDTYSITKNDRLVAAFAPFALYGPAMGIPSVVPAMDVTAPGTLTAESLAAAIMSIEATLVFASPAAWANVVKTSKDLSQPQLDSLSRVRLVLSAGAPIAKALMEDVEVLFPEASIHTPYGMTEVLPVADISLAEIRSAGTGNGVCVGQPISRVEVQISPLDELGATNQGLTNEPEVMGEILVRASHIRAGYDRLWHNEHLASQPAGWHRTGDVGHLDESGRLWVQGRIGHVITTETGLVTPVGSEHRLEQLDSVKRSALVGVGPVGNQVVVAVLELDPGVRRARAADLALSDQCRSAVEPDLSAVLVVPEIPVDRRHNSKVDRERVAAWAQRVLAGGRMVNL